MSCRAEICEWAAGSGQFPARTAAGRPLSAERERAVTDHPIQVATQVARVTQIEQAGPHAIAGGGEQYPRRGLAGFVVVTDPGRGESQDCPGCAPVAGRGGLVARDSETGQC